VNSLQTEEGQEAQEIPLDIDKLVEQLHVLIQTQDGALKVVNMGIVDTLLKITQSKSIQMQHKA
jgi:hypothetical protein